MLPIVIVGAGPYGLSLAAHLQQRRVDFRILGTPMQTWHDHMPSGMLLRSEGMASNLSDPDDALTLERYCAEHGADYVPWGPPVPISQFRSYAQWFTQRLAVPVEDVHVRELERSGSGFVLSLASGEEVAARRVVLAVGTTYFSHVPSEFARLPNDLCTHSSENTDLSSWSDREVVVVGAGQSALETAALLSESGASVRLVARRPGLTWNMHPPPLERSLRERFRSPIAGLGSGWRAWGYSNAPTAIRRLALPRRLHIARDTFGPAGAWWLRDRVESRLPLLLGRTITGVEARRDEVLLHVVSGDGGLETLSAEHVIAATGYSVDVASLPFLDTAVRAALVTADGYPLLSKTFESSVPGLYFVGMAATATFGPVMRFVYGARFAARTIVRAVR
jgi:cation diffusion facilitator CzcD-associated flavoprotein CzcO